MAYGTSNSTYFDNCLMRIMYNTGAFGSNLVANSNVTITVDPAFSATTYLDPQTNVIDETTNTLGIPFGVDFGATSINRTALTIFPTKMLTVKIRIQNCSILSNINFTDVTFTDMFSFYTLIANDPITAGVSYNSTQYNGSITDKTCEPIITSFSNNVPAGIGATFTVNGRYFGDSKGNDGTVIFKNANKGNTYPSGNLGEGIESYDIISWTDNEINIKLPAIIDSIASTQSNPHYRPTPGSGKFKVKNRYGSDTESSTDLTIPYAVYQAIDVDNSFQFTKVTPQLSTQNTSNSYIVHLHPNVVAAYPNVRVVVKKALKDWACVSGIDWQLGNDTAVATNAMDGINMINIGSFSALQKTTHGFRKCINTNPWEYYLGDFDIEINQGVTWQVDTTGNISAGKYDFYHAIAHELGHGHLLMHANDSINGIMFWGAGFGPIPSNQRKQVWSSPAATGAQYVTTNLVSGIAGCVGQHFLNPPTNCLSPISVEEYGNENLNISSYPNPISSGDLTIEFELQESTNTYFFLYDNIGRLIQHDNLEATKKVKYSLPTDNLSNGVYFIQVIADTKRQTIKFIKQ